MAETIAPRHNYSALNGGVVQSDCAETRCRICGGSGFIVERGRHYGDAPMSITCDCYDAEAAQQSHKAVFERHCADNAEADRLMDEASREDLLDMREQREAHRTAIQLARAMVLVLMIVPVVGFIATKGISNVAQTAWEVGQ